MTHRHCHASGRFDVKRIGFARYVRRVVRQHRCDSFSTTESYLNIVMLLRVLFGPRWIIVRSGEYVIGVKRSSYKRTKLSMLQRLSEFYAGKLEWRDLFAHRRTFVLVDDGLPVMLVGFHGPSGVQLGRGWAKGIQVRTALTGYTNMGEAFAVAIARRPTLRIVASGDTNQELRNGEMRAEFERMLGLECCWSVREPAAGTHDARRGRTPTRCIDATFSNVAMSDPVVAINVRRPPGLDHVATVTQLDYAA